MATYKSQKQHAPVDESVQIPAAIRAAAARSEALHQTAYKTEAAPEKPKEPDGKEAPKQEPPAEPKTPEKVAEPKTPEPNSAEDWENRYKAMKGRNDRNEQMLSEQGRTLIEIQEELQRMRAQPAPMPTPTNENTFGKITDKDREDFGADFIDVAKRAAAEEFAPLIDSLKKQVTELGGKVETVARTSHDTQTSTMNEKLDKALPTWREINRNQKFLAWVGLRDPYSGAIRIEMMRAAHAAGDANRVLAFFKGFLSDEATTAPTDDTKSDFTDKKVDKVSLESLAAPGRAKASASDAPKTDPADKEIITRAQVQEFYKLVNSGHYRGRDAEKADLERRIFEANADGRVR